MAAARPLRLALLLPLAFLLVACAGVPGGGPGVVRGVPVPVALLVPGSGGRAGDAVVSRDLERAARLAAADLGGAVELRVYETGGTAAGASASAARAVREGAAVIAGPLYAGAANAAGLAAAPSGVNVLAFSNNTAIAGGNVFVLGRTFDNTAERLLRFAARQGRDDVLVVAASNAAGEAARAAVQRAAAAAGARVVGVVRYDFSEQGVAAAAPAVARAAREGGADTVVLTSDTAGALPLLAQLLPEAGVAAPAQQFVGLTRWDIPPATLSLTGLQGGWFALPDQARAAAFRSRFQEVHQAAPHPLAGLAYDAVTAVGTLAAEGRAPGARELARARGFEGTDGVFRLRSDGTVERGLAVAQVRGGRAALLDPAPGRFGGGLGLGL